MSGGAGLTFMLLLGAAITCCGGDDGAGGAKPESDDRSAAADYENPPMHARVEITQKGYKPKHTRILVGGTVTFVNVDETESHTAETEDLPEGLSDNNEFDTHTLTWEEPYTVTFHKPEKVTFHNSLEPGMSGTISAVPKVKLRP